MAAFVSDLNAPLLRISPHDVVTLASACGGIHAFGGIGSGKSSGLGRMCAGAFLRAGFGGLVTVAKPGEIDVWRRYCAEHGRAASLVVFDENEGFNFLDYELGRQGMSGIGTVVECLMRILEAAKRASPTASQRGGEQFWEDATRQTFRRTLPPLYAAQGRVTIPGIIDFINSAPASVEELASAEWQRSSFMKKIMDAAATNPRVPMDAAALEDTFRFWTAEWPRIPDKTRGNIVISATTVLDRFRQGRLQRAFCGNTTSVVPEMSFHGAVIVLAMPTLTWNEDGVIAQVLFKYMWQRAVLSRNSLEQKHRERPLFLYSDEAQETVSSDGEFLGLCRDSKCCVLFMTQSLPAYFSKIGGDNPRDAALNLAGKFMTHVYFSNGCAETNEFAARAIGKVIKRRANYSAGSSDNVSVGMNAGGSSNRGSSSGSGTSHSYGAGPGSHSMNFNSGGNRGEGESWGENRGRSTGTTENRGYSESTEYAVEPGDFARCFKTGGAANNFHVTGLWFRAGETFRASGTNVLPVTFSQR